ncbi:alkaline phosphatase D family protein [Larsenimonas salina]|uniref:alkaline phosphatase D family protein n=1 Tax=Larsenimonas salina TaxID=1295565 RepID=UPI002073326F|nr:alkaline phosphatase D family protein [Larsenimonas salina]MCM5704449.1 alkaline phosphatase D family protein [Larsenimonas salina]
MKRRDLLTTGIKGGLGLAGLGTGIIGAPAIVLAEGRRPEAVSGVMSGDVLTDRAMLWSRADRPAIMQVDISKTPDFAQFRRLPPVAVLPETGLVGKLDATGLAGWDHLYYRVRFQSPGDHRALSAPVAGSLPLPPTTARNVRFVWSGDVAGQGWGIDESRGGMTIFETMRKARPDFFLHSGDTVYADGPMEERVALEDGSVWQNVVTPAKQKVAETLEEYRGQHAYNLLDANVRALYADVPMLAQWDDHETVNNWYPGELLDDDRYREKNVSLLSARARQAFVEFTPTRLSSSAPDRLYRRFPYGPGLEVFMLDMRSYRGPNSANVQTSSSPATDFLGKTQFDWLKQALLDSSATWKIIAADMPVGLVVADGDHFEAIANRDDGAPKGRELELARLLRFIRDNAIQNVVWFTADVHYTAAHHYSPERAAFKAFTPFWEFVSGPLHAGTFGPGELDATFGPKVVFQKAPPDGQKNLPPSRGYQFFGQVDLDGESEALTVTLKDSAGTALHRQVLTPTRA